MRFPGRRLEILQSSLPPHCCRPRSDMLHLKITARASRTLTVSDLRCEGQLSQIHVDDRGSASGWEQSLDLFCTKIWFRPETTGQKVERGSTPLNALPGHTGAEAREGAGPSARVLRRADDPDPPSEKRKGSALFHL